MRGDNLERHTKKHEKKTSGIYMVTEKTGIKRKIDEDGTNRIETCSEKSTNLEVLEKNVRSYVDEFNRNRNIYIIGCRIVTMVMMLIAFRRNVLVNINVWIIKLM